jgi:hypothetical protein
VAEPWRNQYRPSAGSQTLQYNHPTSHLMVKTTPPPRPGKTPVPRGTILRPATAAQLPSRDRLHIGVGRALDGRVALFKAADGMAVEMVERVYDIPPCNGAAGRREGLSDCLCAKVGWRGLGFAFPKREPENSTVNLTPCHP